MEVEKNKGRIREREREGETKEQLNREVTLKQSGVLGSTVGENVRAERCGCRFRRHSRGQ